MSPRIKIVFAILLVMVALPTNSFAHSMPIDRDFTVSIGDLNFGFSGCSAIAVTYVEYGFGTWTFHQPFHLVVSSFSLIPVLALAGCILALRRRREKLV